ncbi:hypothetical protein GEV33_003560 [Tenebrio molitor]|uniref:SH2 domain-containing protein n=1 Tax=Tenebrio molitor TaxID=7067 RepID=A0A8J6LF85_TENMO|nr:hypothetical protein GEV33_003560 [Tenebrio molitor]
MCILTYFVYLVDSLVAFLVPYSSALVCGLNKRIRARVQNGHESIAHNADNPRMDGMRTASLWGSPEPLMYLHEFLVEKSRLFSRRFYNARSDRIKDVGGDLSSVAATAQRIHAVPSAKNVGLIAAENSLTPTLLNFYRMWRFRSLPEKIVEVVETISMSIFRRRNNTKMGPPRWGIVVSSKLSAMEGYPQKETGAPESKLAIIVAIKFVESSSQFFFRDLEDYFQYTTKNLTWLQKQQLKLKERREVQLREERHPHETRLLSELRHVQSRHMKPTASHRLDGYTSDTTAFADDDEDYTIPLHINTTQKSSSTAPGSPRTMMRTYSANKTSYTSKNERPFMTVKRAHERYAQNSDSSPASILAANPLGQIVRPPSRGGDTVDSGLLSLVEQEQYNKHSPRYNQAGLVGIENDSSVDSSPADMRNDSIRIDALNDLIASLSSGSDKSSNSPNNTTSAWQYREETHSWRSHSTNDADTSPSHNSSPRPQTPAFPVHVRTPYTNPSTPTVQFDLPSERLPPKSPTTQRKDRPTSPTDMINGSSEYFHSTTQRSVSATPPGYKDNYSENYQHSPKSPTRNGSASPTVYFGNSRRSSVHSNSEPPHEVSAANVKFVRDTSKYWYKPTISREEAINMLRDQPPGTFVVRDSNSFPGAFGMALKVSTIPTNLQSKPIQGDELIRHFLIEPTSRGVKLKGCPSEPVFSSLSALVYQHSVTPLALPCRLILPEGDLKYQDTANNPAQQLLTQGAACNVLYLFTFDMESLTGPEAVRKAVNQVLQKSKPDSAVVHFKVNGQGITLTDNKRKLFFRRHYPINTISHCGLDPEEHRWTISSDGSGTTASPNRIFGFIARKPNVSNPDNQCHLFAELEPEQPAIAIMDYIKDIAELREKIKSRKTESDFGKIEQYHWEIKNELTLKRDQVFQLKKELDAANSKIFELNRQLEANRSTQKETEFNLKLALKKSASVEEKLKEINEWYTDLKLKEEMRMSILNENVVKIAHEKLQLSREADELNDKVKYSAAFQNELEERQNMINSTMVKTKADVEKLENEHLGMIEFEKKLQGAEEFEKLSQQLAQEIKKLKSRYNCLENALIETTAKYEKLSSLLGDQKKTDKKLLPKIQFLQWEKRCKQFQERNSINEEIIRTLSDTLNQKIELNARLTVQIEKYEDRIEELEKKLTSVKTMKEEKSTAIEIE